MTHPYWAGDPYRQARIALQHGDPTPALGLLAAARGDATYRIHAICWLVDGVVPQLPLLETRLGQDPWNPDLWLLVGAVQQEAAWDARGADRIANTSEDQIRGLLHHMTRARSSLRRAAELLPDDPAPWFQLMSCAMAAKSYPGEMHDMWKELVQRGGDVAYQANRLRLVCLTEKWHGSEAECFAFARERTRDLPPGHPLHALVPLAHVEAYVELRSADRVTTRVWAAIRYLSKRPVKTEIDQASDRLLAGSDAFAGHPASREAHQAFACVYADNGDLDRARHHLIRSGDEATWPWTYFGDKDELFERARVRAGLPPRHSPPGRPASPR
ncbi:hypothetical protein OHA21_50500 [Actinoplanes sp. NBC_00393]|uniref:hypothetical protein n=1 Tax=Actinoplanes sp. NBC_00393 TaxID=2975953 RepID=UPI002E239492